MTFRDWQSLDPAGAAREIHRRVRALSPSQQRASFFHLAPEAELAAAFERSAASLTKPLARVPFALKDLFDVAGLPTFAGSTFLPEVRSRSQDNSHLLDMLQAAGAVLAGKTHLHEFAYGITGENPHYGDCEHPRFPGRTSGGSSSGSAVSVAAGIVPLAVGTDTGGSIRVPAAFCGLFGFRLPPRHTFITDAFPLAPSFDTAGWFTSNAADMRVAIEALVGIEPSTREPRGRYFNLPHLNSDVSEALARAAAEFASVAESDLQREFVDGFAHALDTYNTIVAAEAWETHRGWFDRYRPRYDPAVAERLQRGAALAAGNIEAARQRLESARSLWETILRDFDFVILPATPFPALSKADCTAANRARLLTLTAPASLGGLPVITVPVRLPSGLTSGLQIVVRDPKSPVIPWVLERAAGISR